jgi:hypothetical protein
VKFVDTATLRLETGKHEECSVVLIFEVDHRQYIALSPLEESSQFESETIQLFELETLTGNQGYNLLEISEPLFDNVADVFCRLLES